MPIVDELDPRVNTSNSPTLCKCSPPNEPPDDFPPYGGTWPDEPDDEDEDDDEVEVKPLWRGPTVTAADIQCWQAKKAVLFKAVEEAEAAGTLDDFLRALTTKPSSLPANQEGIPEQLKTLPQWVLWRWVKREGVWTKVPCNAATGCYASAADRTTWSSFEVVWEAYRNSVGDPHNTYDGVGFVFAEGGAKCGIDLDKCRNPETGAIDAWAMEIIQKCPSYAEVSPSETGVKMYGVGNLPGKGRSYPRPEGGKIEVYDQNRFFVVTGQKLPEATGDLCDYQEAVDFVLSLMPAPETEAEPSRWAEGEIWSNGFSDEEVVDKCRSFSNAGKFNRLFDDDDLTGYGEGCGNGAGEGASEADMALLSRIAFVTGPDPEQIKRIFYASARGQREKVLSREDDYIDPTIEKILDGRGDDDYYKPRGIGDFRGNQGSDSSSIFCDASIETTSTSVLSEGFEDIGDEAVAIVPFPVDVFPPAIREVVGNVAKAIGTPPDYFAVASLVTAGVAVGSHCKIDLVGAGPQRPNLFACIVAPSGAGKTPSTEAAVCRLKEIGNERYRAWKTAAEEERQEADDTGRSCNRKRRLYARTWCDDATSEAHAAMFEANPKGFLIYPEELSGLVGNFNRFKKGKGSDRQVCLKLWTGQDINLTRADGRDTLVEKSFASILGSMPPGQLRDLATPNQSGDGFFERFLFSWPQACKPLAYDDLGKLTEETTRNWDGVVTRLFGINTPFELTLSPEAELQWRAGYNAHREKYDGLSDTQRSIWSKAKAHAARFICILHMMKWATGTEAFSPNSIVVNDVTVVDAWTLVRYFTNSGARVSGFLSDNVEERKEQKIREVVKGMKQQTFRKNELFQHVRKGSMFKLSSDLDAPLHRMVVRGEYRKVAPPSGRAGRPTELYEVVAKRGDEPSQ